MSPTIGSPSSLPPEPRILNPVNTLSVTDLPYGGRGIGRLEGKVCFVPGVLPGETVRVKIIRDRGDFLEAEPLEILTPSPHRIQPACPLASSLGLRSFSEGGCPGCCYQHVDYTEEVSIKNEQLRNLLARQTATLLPPVPAPSPLGYRNKMALHAQADGKDMRLGYFMADNTTILDVPSCPLAAAPLNAILEERRCDPSFFRTLRDGMTVTFRWTEKDGAQWWRNRASEKDVWLVESSVIGPLSVPRNSFFQMNPAMADHLVTAVMERLKADLPDTVIDLYCGVGVFALAAATLGIPKVLGIDLDGPGIKAAEHNARKLGLNNTRWKAAAAQESILDFELEQPDRAALIVDPPRSGLGRKLIQEILKHKPRRLLYISCAPDTMVRDAAWLADGGYSIRSSQLFDLFPRTAHFESLTEFSTEHASG
ncbi:MAG: class I SAM-dependent RNA methyltransferase [bacterium]